MIYSVGCEYAIRALVKIAGRGREGTFFLLRDIVEEDALPPHFVGKILQSLVRAGILVSAKGRGGGFALQRPASNIRLREVVNAIDGDSRLQRCILGYKTCDEFQTCPQHAQWVEIRAQIDRLLDGTTLQDLLASGPKKQPAPVGQFVGRRKLAP